MRHRFHSICPYFAMFPEEFVRKYLFWTEPGDLIFDPFSGRGTTVFESLLNQREAMGCDTNPVAVCISNAKADPPDHSVALARLAELERSFTKTDESETEQEFFRSCFHTKTLDQVLYLRRSLDWRERREDCFLAALALGALHGESHRSQRYFSNRMPRTISTKPAYSIRWWRKHGYQPPERDVFEILRDILAFRMVSPPPTIRGRVLEGDARQASKLFPHFHGRVRMVLCSPPYIDTTNYLEDQWLRFWFLGGPPHPSRGQGTDDRHRNLDDYWNFLTEAWAGLHELLTEDARLIIRIGGRKLDRNNVEEKVGESLSQGLSAAVRLIERHESPIRGNQSRAFRPGAKGCQVEIDLHFALA